MAKPKQDNFVVTDYTQIIADYFSHDAMATKFEIIIDHENPTYARQAALECFLLIDRLERTLSRFVENSEISQLNNYPAGKELVLSLEVFEVLQKCKELCKDTNGAFDVSVGPLMDLWLGPEKELKNPDQEQINRVRKNVGMSLITLHEKTLSATKENDDVAVDLGGFGKGFALDKIALLLAEWQIERAFLNAGSSTVLAMGPPKDGNGWPVTISNPTNRLQTLAQFELKNMALSGSGLDYGFHIIDPRQARPISGNISAWACTDSAAKADALSTAFMIISAEELEDYCFRNPDTMAMKMINNEQGKPEIARFGPWHQLK